MSSRQGGARLHTLDQLSLEDGYRIAKERLERQLLLWDWDEDVDLIGVARLIAVRR